MKRQVATPADQTAEDRESLKRQKCWQMGRTDRDNGWPDHSHAFTEPYATLYREGYKS